MKIKINKNETTSSVNRERVKDQTLDQLRLLITSGVIDVNKRLPSERALAEQLGVGRNSVREALKVLEALGMVESRVGDGTFVVSQTGTMIGRNIGQSLVAQGNILIEIHDARRIIEASLVRESALHATPQELRALADELHKMDTFTEFREYLRADMNFHRVLAQASHNTIVWQIVIHLIDLLEASLDEIHYDDVGTPYEGKGTHHLVYAAVLRKDPDAAERAMREHLDFATQFWRTIIALTTSPADE